MHDVVISNVTIVDGTGAAAAHGHVAVKDGVITVVDSEVSPAALGIQARTTISGTAKFCALDSSTFIPTRTSP